MKIYDYLPAAAKTEKLLDTAFERVTHHMAGVTGEVGEVIDMLKKSVIYDRPLDRAKFVKELGDVCWYLAGLCNTLGLDGNQVEHHMTRSAQFGRDLHEIEGDFHCLRETLFLSRMIVDSVSVIEDLPTHEDRVIVLGNAFNHLLVIGAGWIDGLTLAEILKTNIDKLSVRHAGGGYTSEGQLAQADEKLAEKMTAAFATPEIVAMVDNLAQGLNSIGERVDPADPVVGD
jgi:NTP pyrophosphatase (non-canonical NTP hydrolase)